MLKMFLIGGAIMLLLPFLHKFYLLYRVYWGLVQHRIPPFIFFPRANNNTRSRVPIGFGGVTATETAEKKN